MPRELGRNLCIAIASSISYSLAYVLRIIWDLHLYYFILIVFIFGLLFGLVMVNIEGTIIYSGVSLLLGAVIGCVLIVSPALVFAENIVVFNLAVLTTIHAVLLHLLFSLVVGFFGAIMGFFLREQLPLRTM